jgi:hypothetical protein
MLLLLAVEGRKRRELGPFAEGLMSGPVKRQILSAFEGDERKSLVRTSTNFYRMNAYEETQEVSAFHEAVAACF